MLLVREKVVGPKKRSLARRGVGPKNGEENIGTHDSNVHVGILNQVILNIMSNDVRTICPCMNR